jgi:hypothetical protein
MHVVALTPTIKPGATAKFKIVASKVDTTQGTVVNYGLGGTAVSGVDYDSSNLTGQITIPAGSRSALLQLNTMKTGSTKRRTATTSILAGGNYRPAQAKAIVIITGRTQ